MKSSWGVARREPGDCAVQWQGQDQAELLNEFKHLAATRTQRSCSLVAFPDTLKQGLDPASMGPPQTSLATAPALSPAVLRGSTQMMKVWAWRSDPVAPQLTGCNLMFIQRRGLLALGVLSLAGCGGNGGDGLCSDNSGWFSDVSRDRAQALDGRSVLNPASFWRPSDRHRGRRPWRWGRLLGAWHTVQHRHQRHGRARHKRPAIKATGRERVR